MAGNTDNIIYSGDMMLFAGSTSGATQPIAFSTSAKLSIKAATRSVSSKDSGVWDESLAGKLSWEVSSDALYSMGTTGTTNEANDLYALMIARTPIYVAFAKVGGTTPSWTVATSVKYTGQAIITGLDITANDGDNVTYSISMTGTGALTYA